MTSKADFNAEEWDLVTQAPALAALAVAAADRGGTLRESVSLARAYSEARKRGGDELVDQLVSSAPSLDPRRFKSPDQVAPEAEDTLRRAVDLLSGKATPEEVEDYKHFVTWVADTVARAHKEGGMLGIGGKEVSAEEQAMLDRRAATLGTKAPEQAQ